MKFFVAFIFLFITLTARSQSYTVTGHIVNESNKPLTTALVKLAGKDTLTYSALATAQGDFIITNVAAGFYYVTVAAPGYEDFIDSVALATPADTAGVGKSGALGLIMLLPKQHMLDEVKIVEKVLAMTQKGDTLEFNSGAFKVNPDADAADLVRKMPTIQINDKQITAQGESVVKILVDGKPFFGTDPYAALKNLPAEVIDKVQVYNEKSDQEQFTGFSEGNTSKTINIITKASKRNGLFGKVYAGAGGDPNTVPEASADGDIRYGAGATLNKFAGDRRFTLTAQSNNVNVQNFSDNGAAGDGGAGLTKTNAAGLNYSDKWGKKIDLTGSYFFNQSHTSVFRQLQKTYVLASDSGQVYNEVSPSSSASYGHRFSLRFTYNIDSVNSVLVTPSLSYNKNTGNNMRVGNTYQDVTHVNYTANASDNDNTSYTFTNNILYRHRFRAKGRTFSASFTSSANVNDGNNRHIDTNVFYASPALSDTLNQHTLQRQHTYAWGGNVSYTEPAGKDGMIKAEYNINYTPARSERNTYDLDALTGAYSRLDSQYSSAFTSANTAHKAGLSYQHHIGDIDISFGLNYQLTRLSNSQSLPISYSLGHTFQNVLPVAYLHYKLSASRSLVCNYSTFTQPPSVSQLQNVINNADPLHLYEGNPDLKQPYRHNLVIRYNSVNKDAGNNFSATVNGSYSQHNIASSSIIAQSDSLLRPQNVAFAKSAQLTMPVNVDGNSSVTANCSYSLPLKPLKCRLNVNLNAGITRNPSLINNQLNYQENHTGGLGLSVGSNISENIDFVLSSNTNLNASANSVNTQLNTTYISEIGRASINLQSHSGFVFNTSLSYLANSGIAYGYDQSSVLCNISVGKKVFSKHQGDIRLSVFDLLNQNSSIQHTVTDSYIQDTRTNILRRYFLLAFTYKISEFHAPPKPADSSSGQSGGAPAPVLQPKTTEK